MAAGPVCLVQQALKEVQEDREVLVGSAILAVPAVLAVLAVPVLQVGLVVSEVLEVLVHRAAAVVLLFKQIQLLV